jgi:hypothetical protein
MSAGTSFHAVNTEMNPSEVWTYNVDIVEELQV